ncbi:hypothetical protein FQZ97_447510 [compost metagenome]
MGAGDFRLGLGGHGADHGQAEQLGPLRDDQAHATGGGMQEDAVAFLEVVDAAHQVGGGQAAHGHGGSGFEGDGLGQPDQRRRRHQALGGVGAQGVEKARVGDAVAQGDIAHALAHRHHHAGSFDADTVGQRNRVGAVAEIGVGVVQAYGDVTDADFTGSRIADFDVLVAEHFRPPGFIEAYGFGHAFSPIFVLVGGSRTHGLDSRHLPSRMLHIARQRLFIS